MCKRFNSCYWFSSRGWKASGFYLCTQLPLPLRSSSSHFTQLLFHAKEASVVLPLCGSIETVIFSLEPDNFSFFPSIWPLSLLFFGGCSEERWTLSPRPPLKKNKPHQVTHQRDSICPAANSCLDIYSMKNSIACPRLFKKGCLCVICLLIRALSQVRWRPETPGSRRGRGWEVNAYSCTANTFCVTRNLAVAFSPARLCDGRRRGDVAVAFAPSIKRAFTFHSQESARRPWREGWLHYF